MFALVAVTAFLALVTLVLAVANVALARQAYKARVDAIQPAVSIVLEAPQQMPLKLPDTARQALAPVTPGTRFTDADSKREVLIVRACGILINDGPRAATVEMKTPGEVEDSRWEPFNVVDWESRGDAHDDWGWISSEMDSGLGAKPRVSGLQKDRPHQLGPSKYLVLAGSIYLVRVNVAAPVAVWGNPFDRGSSIRPTPHSVTRHIEIRAAAGGGATDEIEIELWAGPLRRPPNGDGWICADYDEVDTDGGTAVLSSPRSSRVSPPKRRYPARRRGLGWVPRLRVGM